MSVPNTSSIEGAEEQKSQERSPNSQSNKFRSVVIVDEDTFLQKEQKAHKQSRHDADAQDNKNANKKKERDINAYTEDRKLDYKTGQDLPPQESRFLKVETYNNSNSSEEVDNPLE